MFLILGTMIFLPFSALAEKSCGGFISDTVSEKITTVHEVENLPDESYISLKGNITAKIGDEKYSFKDSTGSITIKIDDDDWHGLTVKPGDTVIISGEVNKSWTKPAKIEVDSVRLLK